MATTTPAQVEKYLKGMEFPGHKDDLIKKARDNRAPQPVLSSIQKLPEKKYNSPVDVTKAMKKKK